jgi:transposase
VRGICPGFASELAPHYSSICRPSIDPELMIRMLAVGYVFAIRSEQLICREVRVEPRLSVVLQAQRLQE